jgi:hypothetical protein
MIEGNLIFSQDDTAPDSLEYFNEMFSAVVGMDIAEFKSKAFRGDLKMGTVWRHGGYELSWFCDDPFYALKAI